MKVSGPPPPCSASTGNSDRNALLASIVDLHGGFVIPPLAEGHNHWLEPVHVTQYNSCYIADGVFYVRDLSNMPFIADRIRSHVNLPDTVDWVSTMTSFTGPGGHPVEIVDQFIQFHILPGTWKPDYDEQAMFVVRNEADIDERFALLLKQKPAAVKAFLLYSDRYAGNLTKPETRGNQRGMDPKLLPYLVRKAHSASLKVIVHIYSTADLRNALAAGVDEIAHFPGTGYRSDMPVQDFQITAADAAAVAKAGTPITTTLSWLADMKDDDPEHYQTARDEVVIPNFKLLKNAGVQFLVGSDKFRRDVLPELDLLSSLGMYSNRELLRMDVDATARAIFPGRKIGRLQDGYEASFLVLSRNPEDSLDNLKSITLRVKQGRELRPLQLAIDRPNPDCVEGPPS